MKPRGVVIQMDFSSGLPRVRYRTRNLAALLADVEWDWSPTKADRYVFATFEDAEAHARELDRQGVPHVHAAVYGTDAEREQASERRAPEKGEPLQPEQRKEIVRKVGRIFSPADAEARWQHEHDL